MSALALSLSKGIPPNQPLQALASNSTYFVNDAGWGGANIANLRHLLDHQMDEWYSLTGMRRPIITHVHHANATVPPHGCPMYFEENGEGLLLLCTVENALLQVVYQYAHEYLHLLMAQPVRSNDQFGWLEEVLCETASLFMVDQSRLWNTTGTHAYWSAYQPACAQHLHAELAVAAPVNGASPVWLNSHLHEFMANRYYGRLLMNNMHKTIAQRLLPIFQAAPSGWAVVTSLQAVQYETHTTLLSFFTAWRAASPPQLQTTVDNIRSALV